MTSYVEDTCRLQISAETLSALRDALLTPTEAERLRGHVATCRACAARLAGFDRVATALKRQRDLEPGQRVWRGVQTRLTWRQRNLSQVARRSAIGGITAATVVAALVVLFVGVLNNHQEGPHPISTLTATSAATTIATIPAKLTATPTPPISIANIPTAAQAWGARAATTTLALRNFQMGGMTLDGKRLLGYRPAADGKNFEAGWLDVATQAFTRIDTSQIRGPNKLNSPPTCCLTDGRYYVGNNGVTQGSSATAPWYYDTQTSQYHAINSSTLYPLYVHAGILYSQGASQNGPALAALDLSTGAPVSIIGATDYFNRIAFSWPYAVYSTLSSSTSTIWRAYNFQTGASVTLTQLGGSVDTQINSGTLDGDTLFYGLGVTLGNAGYSQYALEELDHSASPDSRPVRLVALFNGTLGPLAVNVRLVTLGSTNSACQPSAGSAAQCTYSLAWDRTLHKLVLLSQSQDTQTVLAGQYLAVIDKQSNQVTIYNTATLPTQ